MVCRLCRSLYGLKQSPRQWQRRLQQELDGWEFVCCDADASLYCQRTAHGEFMYMLVYVDDFKLAGPGALIATIYSILVDKVLTQYLLSDLSGQGTHLRALLKRYQDICPSKIPPVIPPKRWDLGPFNVIPLQPRPQCGHHFCMSPNNRAELEKQTACLLEQGWIRKSTSEWACSCSSTSKGFQGDDGLSGLSPF
jgi:hypothetical protein